MSWAEKINNKKFFAATAVNIAQGAFWGFPLPAKMAVMIYVVVASALNQYFMILIFLKIIQSKLKNAPKEEIRKLVFQLVGKSFFLISAFILLMVYARELVLYGVILYLFQLIILFLSIKNIGQFFKQGPTT